MLNLHCLVPIKGCIMVFRKEICLSISTNLFVGSNRQTVVCFLLGDIYFLFIYDLYLAQHCSLMQHVFFRVDYSLPGNNYLYT